MNVEERHLRVEVASAVGGPGPGAIEGDLRTPHDPKGIVVFAHGSGSSRMSPRNRMVASVLNDAGFATLLVDLLTAAEESVDVRTRRLRFDIPLLAERLIAAGDTVSRLPEIARLPVGLFGASTGAAAALVAATRAERVGAVVSRGGRPDLAGDALPLVHAPTLLIVGGRDVDVLEMNRDAAARMTCQREIAVVPGATHLFEEPGTLDEAAWLVRAWFARFLAEPPEGPA
ncbi:MAG TPA: dienelactone hydrolase family protein [Actinomycetota bacterium]|nr:dienelactone hydrolase family protein [Actinomycetota bacterium]